MRDPTILPEYSIPQDLEEVLCTNEEIKYPWERVRIFSKVVQTLKFTDSIDLAEDHYLSLMKLALYIEEYQSVSDMKKQKLCNQKITRYSKATEGSKLFRINVGDSIEDKRFVKIDDFVDVYHPFDNRKLLYTLRVTEITQKHIIVTDDRKMFDKILQPKHSFIIQFRLDNYRLRCAHYALWLMHKRKSLTYLFPLKSKPFVTSDTQIDSCDLHISVINPDIENNPEQKQAIINIVNKSSYPAPYILYGPPGTGTTTTLIETIYQLHHNSPEKNILVCTSYDIAADEIAKRLIKFISSVVIYRVYSQHRDGSIVDEELKSCANFEDGKIILPNYNEVIKKRIIITTLCDCTSLLLIGIEADHFSHVIIDEAGCAVEHDVLIPISLVSKDGKIHSQIVLAGDPNQLGPSFKSKMTRTILGRSILERLMSYDIYKKDSSDKYNSKYITKLIINYCHHPDILHISNKLFYDMDLISKCERHENEKFPIFFYGIENEAKKASDSKGIYNTAEIDVVVDMVDDLLCDRMNIGKVTEEDIGIVTPFTLQSKKIRDTIRRRRKKYIYAGTVDLFHIEARKVIIMTTVRSKKYLYNAKLFNLAITKAKQLLIVVGNPKVLQSDEKWRYLIKFCIDNGSYEGMEFTWNKENDNEREALKMSVINSSDLFDKNHVKMFKIDEYNPQISPLEIENSSLDLFYKTFVSLMESEDKDLSDGDMEDENDPKCLFDQAKPKSLDVFKNVDHFDVKQFICKDNLKNASKNLAKNDFFTNLNHCHDAFSNDQTNLNHWDDAFSNVDHWNKEKLNHSDFLKNSSEYQEDPTVNVDSSNNISRCDRTSNFSIISCGNQGNVMEINQHKNIENRDNVEFADSRFMSDSIGDQHDLIDFNDIITDDHHPNLIEFEDTSVNVKNVSKNCDILNSFHVDLL